MKYLVSLLLAITLLSACQQEDNKSKETTPAAVASPATDASSSAEKNKSEDAAQAKSQAAKQAETEETANHAEHDAHQGHDAHEGQDSHAGHDHGSAKSGDLLKVEGPFREVEPQFTCEQPVVMEFYAYQCPHCYDLEPFAQAWREKNKGKVQFISVPTHLGRQEFGSLLLVHHAAIKLGILDKVQHALFERVHKEKKLFGNAEEAAKFLADHGADEAKALEALNDQKGISEAISKDFEYLTKYKIAHVPQIMVNHRYLTDISSAGGREKVFELVDELLQKEHSCRAK
ncbi:thiol:disulfide interchange protein DsbA/DsbL [Aliikangiella maris]|uniref:Thiol:disulfide interchange protein DsbA/DsbL n=2 Tax=Aliikangiella maris TaxID=3162458 RepID=A0ABV3MSS8_9GAMM